MNCLSLLAILRFSLLKSLRQPRRVWLMAVSNMLTSLTLAQTTMYSPLIKQVHHHIHTCSHTHTHTHMAIIIYTLLMDGPIYFLLLYIDVGG